ncbi:MAG: hypothetical protein P8L28_07220, partial [Flavobacteriaceae bacterium]|nr:hypothetical protein [Flavobacteriaceae bacterium]
MKEKKENLKKRAVLNSATSIIDQGSKIVVGFLINPILISELSSYLFGVWQVLNQFTNYTTLANIRVSEVLKWTVAKDRKICEDNELQENLTSSLILIALIIPVFILLGGVLVYYAPKITQVSNEYIDLVRITASILVLNIIVKSVFSLFESVLRGMNIGYKSMGVRASIILFGGVLKVASLKLGLGMIGIAGVQVLMAIITGLTILIIVKRNVSWFGYGKFNLKKTKTFIKVSGWFMAWMGVKTLLVGSDKVLLGYVLGPIYVTKYVVTKYVGQATQSIVTNTIHGVLPGIGALYGQKKFEKLLLVRSEIMTLTWMLSGVIGFIILLFNPSFANLWVGSVNFLNQEANLALLIMITQYLLIQNDSVLINVMLDVKSKTILGFISVILSGLCAYFFTLYIGILGFIIGFIVGRLLLSFSYPKIVMSKIPKAKHSKTPVRLITMVFGFWAVGFLAEDYINIDNWAVLVSSIM